MFDSKKKHFPPKKTRTLVEVADALSLSADIFPLQETIWGPLLLLRSSNFAYVGDL